MRATTYGVPFYLSFDGRNPKNPRLPAFKMGRGEAGYTVAHYATAREALAVAESIPGESQMPSHARLLADLRAAVGV